MTEQTGQDLVQRIAKMEEHVNTAGHAIRDAGSRAQATENRARAVDGTVPTALVDTRLLEKPRTFSGALADRGDSRPPRTLEPRALMRRGLWSELSRQTHDEILNVQLSVADRAMSTHIFYFFVLCCCSGALKTLERAGDTEGATGWRWLVKEHEPDTAGRVVALADPVLRLH